jgi:hypothetical protein
MLLKVPLREVDKLLLLVLQWWIPDTWYKQPNKTTKTSTDTLKKRLQKCVRMHKKSLCCSIAALQIPDANSFCNSIMRASHRKNARRKSARSNHNKRQGRQWESPVGTRRGIICQDLPIPCCKGLEKGCKIAYIGWNRLCPEKLVESAGTNLSLKADNLHQRQNW